MLKNLVKGTVALGALSLATASQAAIDVSDVTDYLSGDATTAIATIGAAALVVIVGLKVWKYLRRAI